MLGRGSTCARSPPALCSHAHVALEVISKDTSRRTHVYFFKPECSTFQILANVVVILGALVQLLILSLSTIPIHVATVDSE